MNIVLPILFFAVGIGLFVPRMTSRWWTVLTFWITLVIAFNFLKGH